eukprot:scaffold2682_cov344-Pavlova_lutheri.AAC.10
MVVATLRGATTCTWATRHRVRANAFPRSYAEVSIQAQESAWKALQDGHRLLEVEFPPCALDAVEGDEEGMREANRNVQHVHTIASRMASRLENGKKKVRVMFADRTEFQVATKGSSGFDQVDAVEPTFDEWDGRLGWLTDPSFLTESGLGALFGMENRVCERLEEDDEMLVMAMPSFSINEMMAVADAWDAFAEERDVPVLVINGSLDRIRSGYYPAFWSRKENQFLRETFVPKFQTVYYIHNFKGSKPAVLFRAYPGPWQVLRRHSDGTMELVHEQDSMPSLKEVALEILPRAA